MGAQQPRQTGPPAGDALVGFLNIDKPPGLTSFDVVRRVRRACGVRRVGHTGTLDPNATGVLPVAVGEATKLVDALVEAPKRYHGVITLGVETDTYDSAGEVVARVDPSTVTAAAIDSALEAFRGELMQTPPPYSAVKRGGVPAYRAARGGTPHALEPRPVTVHSLTVVAVSGSELTVDVECGKGFYMRSLAFDLGQSLGCGGHLKSLIRTKSGPFKVEDAISLEEAEDALENSDWQGILNPPDVVLSSMRATIVGSKIEDMVRNGRALPQGLRIPNGRANEKCRAYSVDGRFIAILTFDATLASWRPEKVFSSSAKEAAPVA